MAKTFIKIIEIWTPSPDKQSLTLSDGYFGKFHEFRQEAERHKFGFGQGLPGKSWATAKPQIITDLAHSYFHRKKFAADIGLNSGVAIPVFSGEFLIAVVVFLCGGNNNEAGALELWASESTHNDKLSLVEGYYGCLSNLETTSRNIKFNKGQGLPGVIWDYHIPMLIADPANSAIFDRASHSTINSINTALGFPFRNRQTDYVISLLSSNDTPIARRFEIWLPDKKHNHLFLYSGKCAIDNNFEKRHKDKIIKRGDGLKGRVWLTGCPAISDDLVADELVRFNVMDNFETGMVMPIIENGFISALVVFIF